MWEATAALEAMGIDPRRSLGQSFLVRTDVADQEAALVDLPPGSPLTEIGGGLGALTRALLRRELGPITVIEKDPRLAAFLATNFPRRVKVVTGDALEVPLPPGPHFVGNLPFSVATPLLERLLRGGMEHGVFLVQREVGERLAAEPGHRSYGPLTILGRVHGEFRLAGKVPSEAFFPPPRVEGVFVVFRRDPLDPAPRNAERFRELVVRSFAQRRKMLSHTLPAVVEGLAGRTVPLEEWLREAGWPEDWRRRRPEEIPPGAFVALSNRLEGRRT